MTVVGRVKGPLVVSCLLLLEMRDGEDEDYRDAGAIGQCTKSRRCHSGRASLRRKRLLLDRLGCRRPTD
jgi:hypothetical protein